MTTTTQPPVAAPWYQDWRKLTAIGVAVLALLIYWQSFSGLIGADEETSQTASQIQNQIQRAADLIPNLVETAKAGAAHENATLTGIATARASATKPVVLADGGQCSVIQDRDKDGNVVPGSAPRCDPSKLTNDPAAQRALAQAAQAMGSININAIREAYPTLQGVALFRDLMAELSGSVNRVSVARRRNLLAVQDYNQRVRRPPGNIVASLHGFHTKPYFEAETQSMPKVKIQ